MKCEFILTPYKNRDGRPVSRCRREGCDQIAFQLPERVVAQCRAPQWAAGDAAAVVLGKVGVTKKTWPVIKHRILRTVGLAKASSIPTPCDCDRRRKAWNRRLSFAWPFWVYRALVLAWKISAGKFGRPPAVDRIAEGLRIGLIR